MAKVFVANGKRNAKRSEEQRNPLPLLIGNPTQRRTQEMAKRKRSKGLSRPMRRNGFIGEPIAVLAKQIAGAAVGFLGDVYIPSTLLGMAGMPDSGIPAYLLALLAVIGPAWGLHKFGMGNLAKGWLLGSGAGFAWRLVDDATGKKLVEVQVQTPQGMSSFYIPQDSVLPGPNVFSKYGRKAMSPGSSAYAAAGSGQAPGSSVTALSKPVTGGMGWARYPFAA